MPSADQFGISHGHALGIAGSDERGHAAILPPSMALFTSDTKDALKKLSAKAYESTEERDALLAKVAAAEGLKASDVVWMLFRPDRALRDWGAAWLRRQGSPELLDALLVESKGK